MNTRKSSRILTSSIAAFSIPLIATLPQRIDAAQIVWDAGAGAASQSWQTASNWAGDVLPGASDIASFAAAGTATAIGSAGNVSIQALQIQSTRTADLTIGNSSTSTNFTLTLAGGTVNSVANTVLSYERTGGALNINNTAAGGSGTGRSFNVVLANATDNIFNVAAGTVTMNTIIGQSAAGRKLTKDGAGVLVLAAANTFSGGVTVRNSTAAGVSTLRVQSSTGLGTGTTVELQAGGINGGQGTTLDLRNNITVAAGKTLTMNSNGTGDLRVTLLNGANNNAWNSDIVAAGTGLVQVNAAANTTLTIGGTITSTGGGTTGTLFTRGGGTVVYNGLINLGTDRLFTKTDAGTVIVNSSGNSWSRTQVANGQIQIGANDALANVDLIFGENNANNGRLELNGFNQALGGLSTFGTSTGTNHILRNSNIFSASTLTFAQPVATTGTATNLQIQGTGTGFGALHMVSNGAGRTEFNGGTLGADSWTVNSGTIAFTGTNNRILSGLVTGLAGATIEKAGASTLVAGAAWNNAGTTNVTGGTLVLRNGTAGAINLSDSTTFSAGLGGGSLSASAVTFGAAGATTYVPLLTAAGAAAPLSTANLTTAGTTVTVVPQAGAFTAGTYRLLDYTGSIGGNGFAGFALAPVGSYPHMTAALDNSTNGQVNLVVTTVDSLIWAGQTNAVWDGNTTANFALASSPSAGDTFYQGDAVVFGDSHDIGAPGTPVTNSTITGGTVTVGNLTFTNSTVNYSIGNSLVGAGGITKTGTGSLTLSGTNGYSGATVLSAGTTNVTGTLSGSDITVAAGASLVSTGTISGVSGLTTSGTTVLRGPSTYSGPTSVAAGTLELDHDGGSLTSTSAVNVATGGTLLLTRDGTATAATTTFTRNLTGSGNVDINVRTGTAAAVADQMTLSGDSSGFSGSIRLLAPTTSGTYRLNLSAPTQAGTGTIEAQNGTQIFATGAAPYANNITIAGTGFADASGNIGALRLDGGTWAGNIVVNGAARIGSHNSTSTISGNISGGDLEFQRTNFNNNYTTILTGTNSYGTTTIGGLNVQTGGVPSFRVNVGAGGTTGSLGTGPVTIHGDGANGVLGFDRADGYTLGVGQTITGSNGTGTIANSIRRTFIDFDTTGTGFDNAGNAITLGTTTIGGNLRFGQARTGTVSTLTGNITAQNFTVGSNAPDATVNLNSTANVNVDFVQLGLGAGINIANTLNINNGATLTADRMFAGQVSGGIGVINQADGSTVNLVTQLRLGHFPNNTSAYNISGGVLTLSGASPDLTPSTSGGGAASATGDNNINALAVAATLGGGIYLGNDGTGVMNHSGGIITTNWMVLDNRVATGAGTNMPDGIDSYTLSGTGLLKLRSTWGLIGRNEGSYAVSFGGGTVQVDNTGTSGTVVTTGANINIPLDATIDTVAASTTTLDTNGAGNGFTLTKDIRGTGTLALTGGGTVQLSPLTTQSISAVFSGSDPINKVGTGTTTLTGANTGYTGTFTVSGGRLNVAGSAGTASVADGAGIGGEGTVGALTLGSATGASVFFDPTTTSAKLTATTLNIPAGTVTTLDFSPAIVADGTYTALSFGSSVGAGTFALNGAANYRSAVVNQSSTAVDVTIGGTKALVWLGTGGLTWDTNTTSNWDDAGNPGTPEKFFNADVVTFDDSAAVGNVAVAVTPGVLPQEIQVNGTTNNYTFTSTGAGIAGGTIIKDGSTTLTLVGANTYPGKTTIQGGTVSIAAANSLGGGLSGNSIALSNGGKLVVSANTAFDFGAARDIAVGSGGGALSVSGAIAGPSANGTTTINYTIPGKISGTGALTFGATGANSLASSTAFANYVLTGDNSGFTGPIVIESASSVMSQVTINQASLPATSSITLNYPAGAVTSGNASTLNLNGVTLPVGTTLNLNAFQTGANISQRSQIVGTGDSVINGPIILTATNGAGATAGGVVNFAPSVTGTSSLTINGNITESVTGFGTSALRGQILFRNNGNTIINGTINLPNANFVSVDPNGSTTVNSTGNVWAQTEIRSTRTLRIGASDALPASAPMIIGQGTDAGNSMFDLNGFNQTVGGLRTITGNGNNSRGVTNSNATTASTLTINTAGTETFGNTGTNQGGNLTGLLHIVKEGTGTQTFAGPANTYTGNVTVNAGTLVAGGGANSNSLGSPTTAGRTVTVNNAGTTLSFTINNVFGNGIGNANLPAVTINAGVLTATNYNVLGNLTLNGGTLTQNVTGNANFEGFQFRGNVAVGGTAASTISTSTSKPNHLGANTVFTVANATGDANPDLVVSAGLRNQSNDFALAVGGLTKDGAGTMELSATNTYTGPTLVSGGELRVSGSISGSTVTVDGATSILSGNGGTVGATSLINGATISPGASPGILNIAGDFSMSSGTNFLGEISGTTAGTDYDQLNVTGTVTLASATLTLGGTYTGLADTFTLILNDGAGDAVGGTFAGLPEGASILAASSGQEFSISYVGGDGNDVVLTAVPEPGSAVMLLSGMGMLLGLQRRRRRA